MSLILENLFQYYHRGVFSNSWKQATFKLYSDGSLKWFEKPNDQKSDGNLVIYKSTRPNLFIGSKNKPPLESLPPKFPSDKNPEYLMAIPKDVKLKQKEYLWIIIDSMETLKLWKHAFENIKFPDYEEEMKKSKGKYDSAMVDGNFYYSTQSSSNDD